MKGFIFGILSMLMVLIVGIGLIGAIVSADIFFKVCGALGLLIWAVIVGKSLKHHDVGGKNHNNWL